MEGRFGVEVCARFLPRGSDAILEIKKEKQIVYVCAAPSLCFARHSGRVEDIEIL
jgi:hypothetical protein